MRIETTWQAAQGITGFVERVLAPRRLDGLYAEELERLDHYAHRQTST